MDNKKLLIGAGVAVAAYLGYKAWNVKHSISFFQYSISSIKFSFKNILQPQILFGIQIYNPNKTGVPVNEFFGTIKYGNTLMASFNSAGPINLSGNETKVIDVVARVNALSLVAQILAGKSYPTVQVDGMIKTSLFDMPLSKTVSTSALSGADINAVGKMRHRFFNSAAIPVTHLQKIMARQRSFLQYQPNLQSATTVAGVAF